MSEKIYIKNMVCPRCIASVEAIFNNFNIKYNHVKLGEVAVPNKISEEKLKNVKLALAAIGFELLEDSKSKIISTIKTLIIDEIHHKKSHLKVNFSTYLSANLGQDYTALSKLFSSVEGITIERFIRMQKIEKVKELLFYNQLSLSEIAFQLNYSSTAHLSAQFKKETGLSPSKFKKLRTDKRNSIDSL